jgi:hypothetical protein
MATKKGSDHWRPVKEFLPDISIMISSTEMGSSHGETEEGTKDTSKTTNSMNRALLPFQKATCW